MQVSQYWQFNSCPNLSLFSISLQYASHRKVSHCGFTIGRVQSECCVSNSDTNTEALVSTQSNVGGWIYS